MGIDLSLKKDKSLKRKAAFLAILTHVLLFIIPLPQKQAYLNTALIPPTSVVIEFQKGNTGQEKPAIQIKQPEMNTAKPLGRILESKKGKIPLPIQKKQTLTSEAVAQPPVKETQQKQDSGLPDRPKAEVLGSIQPIYPKTALNQEWQGKVELDVTIDENGKMKTYEIIKSSGYPILDQALVKALKDNTVYVSKRINGINQSSTIRISYTFAL